MVKEALGGKEDPGEELTLTARGPGEMEQEEVGVGLKPLVMEALGIWTDFGGLQVGLKKLLHHRRKSKVTRTNG